MSQFSSNPTCNKAGNRKSPCEGAVTYWYRATDGKSFPKCERHAEQADEIVRRAQELISPLPAPWFDKFYAGEQWDEEV